MFYERFLFTAVTYKRYCICCLICQIIYWIIGILTKQKMEWECFCLWF